MKNKKTLFYLLLGLSVISGLYAGGPDEIVEETVEEFFDPIEGPVLDLDSDEESDVVHEIIEKATLSAFRAHCNDIDCVDFSDIKTQAEIITEEWIAHLLSASLKVKNNMFTSGAEAITSYLGSDLNELLQRVSTSAKEQQSILSNLIMESFEFLEVNLSPERQKELANLMATEIMSDTLFRYAETLHNPSMVNVNINQGYSGMRNFIFEINELLSEQLTLLSQVQQKNIEAIQFKIEHTDKSNSEAMHKLEKELQSTQEYINRINGLRTLLKLKVRFLNGIEWALTSRWTWPLRFGAKHTAKLGYKAYNMLPG